MNDTPSSFYAIELSCEINFCEIYFACSRARVTVVISQTSDGP